MCHLSNSRQTHPMPVDKSRFSLFRFWQSWQREASASLSDIPAAASRKSRAGNASRVSGLAPLLLAQRRLIWVADGCVFLPGLVSLQRQRSRKLSRNLLNDLLPIHELWSRRVKALAHRTALLSLAFGDYRRVDSLGLLRRQFGDLRLHFDAAQPATIKYRRGGEDRLGRGEDFAALFPRQEAHPRALVLRLQRQLIEIVLLLAQQVPDQFAEFARHGDNRHVVTAAAADPAVERPHRSRCLAQMLGCLDRQPAGFTAATLGDAAVARLAISRLISRRHQAEVRGKLLSRLEAADVADGSQQPGTHHQ